MNISQTVALPDPPDYGEQALQTLLRRCGGYYRTPFDPVTQKFVGPLVGYSGRYDAADGTKKQWVGFIYYNFARTEQYPHVTDYFTRGLAGVVGEAIPGLDCVVGVPEGGLLIGSFLALHLDVKYAGLVKKVVELATETSKEKTELVFGRHDVASGDRVILCEDLTNNFSTADKAIAVVEKAGAQVVGFACALNRSSRVEYNGLPVVSLVYSPTAQFKQDAPEVLPYITGPDSVVWDVKPNWAILEKAMAEGEARGFKVWTPRS